MKMIHCIIVDDEPIARDLLTSYLSRIPDFELVKSCRNADEAYEALQFHTIDIAFLDIQMPVVSGIEFLRSLRHPPEVIFTTAHPQFAVEGFDLNSVDYLLKPITFERFHQAVEKARERFLHATPGQQSNKKPNYIFIKQDYKFVKLPFAEICYIQAERDYCKAFLNDGRSILISMHLKALEELLPEDEFFRIHRSYVIHMDKVQSIQGNTITLGDIEIPIGANYKENFLKKMHL